MSLKWEALRALGVYVPLIFGVSLRSRRAIASSRYFIAFYPALKDDSIKPAITGYVEVPIYSTVVLDGLVHHA